MIEERVCLAGTHWAVTDDGAFVPSRPTREGNAR